MASLLQDPPEFIAQDALDEQDVRLTLLRIVPSEADLEHADSGNSAWGIELVCLGIALTMAALCWGWWA